MKLALQDALGHEEGWAETEWLPLPDFSPGEAKQALTLVRKLQTADAVILAGGTHFHDSFGLRSVRILTSFLILFGFARLFGAKIAHAGVGIGPIHTKTGRLLTKAILSLSAATLVRDSQSAETVRSLRSRTRLIEGFDLAVLLSAPPLERKLERRIIGLSIVPYFEFFERDKSLDTTAVRRL
jgi:polysaccharide pyruvyl transferase WcaK-like protein